LGIDWFDTFDFGPERPMRPIPGQDPDADLLFGYYELEQSERHLTAYATGFHRRQVEIWYRTLTYYYRALDVGRVKSDDLVWFTTWKILRLGISAAKGALDATLAGYYVGAFGDIRQMAEHWFGIEYLALKPESVSGFYAAEPAEEQVNLPYMGKRIRNVLTALSPDGSHPDVDNERFARTVNETYKRMSDGHHLDGLAMVQTGNLDDPGYFLGATYHHGLIREALYHGSLMTGTLAMTAATHLGELLPNTDELMAHISQAVLEAIGQLDPLDSAAGLAKSE